MTKMLHEAKLERVVDVEEYWVLQAIVDLEKYKKVVAEKEFENNPTIKDVAQFLENTGATYAKIESRYRLVNYLPF